MAGKKTALQKRDERSWADCMRSSVPKPPQLIVEIPTDQWGMALLFFNLNRESADHRIMEAIKKASEQRPTAKLSSEQRLEIANHAIELLSPRFDADQFHLLGQKLGLGSKFTLAEAGRMLERFCRQERVLRVSKGTKQKAAIYRVPRRRRLRRT